MSTKKKTMTQKKVVKTAKSEKPGSRKTIGKIAARKVSTPSGTTSATKRVAPEKKVIVKEPSRKTARPVRMEKDAPSTSKEKKKLSPREKAILEIKRKLVAQRNVLLNEAEEALNMLPGQTIFPDLGDQASAEIDRNFMLRLRGREQRLLKKIEEAIEKIDTGSFGVCEVCGEDIDVKRLEARPVTTMCIFCKTEQEEEEKLRGT